MPRRDEIINKEVFLYCTENNWSNTHKIFSLFHPCKMSMKPLLPARCVTDKTCPFLCLFPQKSVNIRLRVNFTYHVSETSHVEFSFVSIVTQNQDM